jgi:hypothetical protein
LLALSCCHEMPNPMTYISRRRPSETYFCLFHVVWTKFLLLLSLTRDLKSNKPRWATEKERASGLKKACAYEDACIYYLCVLFAERIATSIPGTSVGTWRTSRCGQICRLRQMHQRRQRRHSQWLRQGNSHKCEAELEGDRDRSSAANVENP